MQKLIAGMAFTLLLARPVQAEDRFPSLQSENFEWGLGIGALIEDAGYQNIGSETNGQPVLYLANQDFRFFANQFNWNFLNNQTYSLGLEVEARFDGFEPDDDAFFTGMEERDDGVYGGLRGEWKSSVANFVFEWMQEVSGDSDGAYGSLNAYWTIDTGFGQLVPKIALEYYDRKYSDYYFGVRADEVRPDRPAYAPDSSIGFDVGIDYIRSFNTNHRLIGSIKYRRYDSEVSDSPLIESDGSPRFVLGYFYSF